MAVKAKAKAKRNKEAEARAAYVKLILDANGAEVEETVDKMCDVMGRMAPNVAREIHRWIAVRLLVSAAEWEIRIANFKAPKKKCVRCGKKA